METATSSSSSSSPPEPRLRFYHEPEPNFELMQWFHAISVIQFFVEILTIFHVSYILYIFIKVKVCHRNLRTICFLFLIDLIVKAVFNVIILLKFITGKTIVWESTGYFIVNFCQWTSNAAYYFFPVSFFLERSISLIWAKNYETFYSPTLLALLCGFPLISATYITIHVLFLYFWIPIALIYNVSNFFLIFCWTGYLLVFLITKKYIKKTFEQSLSEKFQRYENLKTNKTMFWFAIVAWISVILGTIYIQIFTHYKAFFPNLNETNMNAICRLTLDTIQAFIFLLLPISFTFTHNKLKTKYLNDFKKYFKRPTKVSNSTISHQSLPVVESVMGKSLVCENEQEFYFKQLANDWNVKLKETNQ